MNDESPEALRRLEQRLSKASNAAERLIAEAARTAQRHRPPPQGWQAGPSDEEPSAHPASELELVLRALAATRDLVPPEVAERLAAAARELLLAVRALIDFYLERLERQDAKPDDGDVQDIPIA
jgi:hypothetical protein